MPKPLDPAVGTVLKQYGFGREAIWDCHGTWVVYHRVLEQIAAKAGIEFDLPLPLETNGAAKTVALCVAGKHGERSEWSVGEASPANNKNAYPYAMAEKRAKDRVILKLIGLHGLVYSEEEADDFKDNAQRTNGNGRGPDWGKASQAKKNGDWEAFERELAECGSTVALDRLQSDYEEKTYPNWNRDWREQAHEAFEKRRDELAKATEPRTVAASKQAQGRRERKPGPRLSPEDSETVAKTLLNAMKMSRTAPELDEFKEREASKINSLIDEHYWSLILEGSQLRKRLPESTLAAG